MLTLEKAQKAIETAQKKAKELGIAVTVTVVDEHGSLVAAGRMDGALTISPKFAFSKAFTAATIGLQTSDIAQYAGEGKPYYGAPSAFGGELMVIAGGLPIKENNKVIGGIGVGGSYDVNQDVECAKAGSSVFS